MQIRNRQSIPALLVLCSLLALYACDEDGTNPAEEPTGALVQGQVTAFDPPASAAASGPRGAALTPGIRVSIGTRATETDEEGNFALRDVPIGDQILSLTRDGSVANFALSGIVGGATFTFGQMQYSGSQITTEHTGTWVGTGGSTDPGSQGQIALTMVLQANGNSLTGTASIGSPDNTIWSISGHETGTTVHGHMEVVSTNSPCASGGRFDGTFDADTLSGDFREQNPPSGCGEPEDGIFRVVRQ